MLCHCSLLGRPTASAAIGVLLFGKIVFDRGVGSPTEELQYCTQYQPLCRWNTFTVEFSILLVIHIPVVGYAVVLHV